ncbi:MAG: C10 family peptidase [Bacteroidaceae bacterium]|nr:C10 family peptidase [Bacteroidaceae bacterium]
MKKIIILLTSLVLLFSCSEDEKTTTTDNKFHVDKKDIELVVNDFTSKTVRSSSLQIVSVDSLSNQEQTTRGEQNTNAPQTLLYFVKLSDNSTVIVAGDKRAEPVCAHISNLELKFGNGKLLNQNEVPESFKYMLGVSAASVMNCASNESEVNPNWTANSTRATEDADYIQPSKCKVAWGQGNPFNLQSPASTGDKSSEGKALAGSTTIAAAQALTVLCEDFHIFKGYALKTSWGVLKTRNSFYNQDEIKDISNIVKRIADNIDTSYNKNGTADANTRNAILFLNKDLGGAYGHDSDWEKVESNMKDNPCGISFLSAVPQSNGRIWNIMGIDKPSQTEHCMLLDGYKKANGRTLFYINFGWNGEGNGYFLYDDKTWNEGAPKEYCIHMNVYNFHLDTDFDNF